MSPYPCNFRGHCWQGIPQDSIFSLSELEEDSKWQLYRMGVTGIHEIPKDFPLTKAQKTQAHVIDTGELYIDHNGIRDILDGIKPGAAFLDLNFSRAAAPLVK